MIMGMIKSIEYIICYIKKKESMKNEKYIILFTDLLNYISINDTYFLKKLENIGKAKDIHFLLVGKNRNRNLNNEKIFDENEKKMEEIIFEKFGEKSELIDFDNMKKIQTILSSNNVIKNQIIYPNEIYK